MLVGIDIEKPSWEKFIWRCVLATRTRFLHNTDQTSNRASISLANTHNLEYLISTPYYVS